MANKSDKIIKKATDCKTWSDLFKFLSYTIKSDIRCHTLARFVEIEKEYNSNDHYGIAKMQPFPLIEEQQAYTIHCYFFKEDTENLFYQDESKTIPNKERIFLIEFMDYNFKTNLENTTPIKTSDSSLHDMSFGVLIDTL